MVEKQLQQRGSSTPDCQATYMQCLSKDLAAAFTCTAVRKVQLPECGILCRTQQRHAMPCHTMSVLLHEHTHSRPELDGIDSCQVSCLLLPDVRIVRAGQELSRKKHGPGLQVQQDEGAGPSSRALCREGSAQESPCQKLSSHLKHQHLMFTAQHQKTTQKFAPQHCTRGKGA